MFAGIVVFFVHVIVPLIAARGSRHARDEARCTALDN